MVWCSRVWVSMVWCSLVWFSMVWCSMVWCSMAWCSMVWCSMERCSMVWCSLVWCSTVWFSMVWCSMVLYYTHVVYSWIIVLQLLPQTIYVEGNPQWVISWFRSDLHTKVLVIGIINFQDRLNMIIWPVQMVGSLICPEWYERVIQKAKQVEPLFPEMYKVTGN